MTMGLKIIFPLKAESEGFCIELVLVTAILDAAAWFVACIWQPDDSYFCKHSNSPEISVHLYFLSP